VTYVAGPVRVVVPATSANLGPGYDALGLALTLHDELTAEVLDDGLEVTVEGEGAGTLALDETHLVVRSMWAGFAAMGVAPPGVRLHCRNVIPHSRGLGSSSAAIVGGLALARALVADGEARLPDADLVSLAADLEGHADNVAPAVMGGFIIAGLLQELAAGESYRGATVAVTVTGHGLKDTGWVVDAMPEPVPLPPDVPAAARALGLAG
jgi:homoserine kinase